MRADEPIEHVRAAFGDSAHSGGCKRSRDATTRTTPGRASRLSTPACMGACTLLDDDRPPGRRHLPPMSYEPADGLWGMDTDRRQRDEQGVDA
jgi:hypothetical protein